MNFVRKKGISGALWRKHRWYLGGERLVSCSKKLSAILCLCTRTRAHYHTNTHTDSEWALWLLTVCRWSTGLQKIGAQRVSFSYYRTFLSVKLCFFQSLASCLIASSGELQLKTPQNKTEKKTITQMTLLSFTWIYGGERLSINQKYTCGCQGGSLKVLNWCVCTFYFYRLIVPSSVCLMKADILPSVGECICA